MHVRAIDALIAAGLFSAAILSPTLSHAMGTEPNPTLPSTTTTAPKQHGTKATTSTDKKKPKKTKQQQSEILSAPGYRTAWELIYTSHDYAAGIAQLRDLKHDDDADVATLLGYASRKLGRYDDSKSWYERALASDPRHARTWSYYGMWHAEQGNLLKARDYLDKVASLCGTGCREYTELKEVIEGTRTY